MTAALARSVALGMALAVVLSGCGVPQRLGFFNATPEVTLPFRSKLTPLDEDRRFVVRVQANGAGIADVRESVRHPATAHCLLEHGGSDIDWDLDAAGEWRPIRDADGGLTFSGICSTR